MSYDNWKDPSWRASEEISIKHDWDDWWDTTLTPKTVPDIVPTCPKLHWCEEFYHSDVWCDGCEKVGWHIEEREE